MATRSYSYCQASIHSLIALIARHFGKSTLDLTALRFSPSGLIINLFTIGLLLILLPTAKAFADDEWAEWAVSPQYPYLKYRDQCLSETHNANGTTQWNIQVMYTAQNMNKVHLSYVVRDMHGVEIKGAFYLNGYSDNVVFGAYFKNRCGEGHLQIAMEELDD